MVVQIVMWLLLEVVVLLLLRLYRDENDKRNTDEQMEIIEIVIKVLELAVVPVVVPAAVVVPVGKMIRLRATIQASMSKSDLCITDFIF